MSTLQLIAVCVNKLIPKDIILRLYHLWHKEMGTCLCRFSFMVVLRAWNKGDWTSLSLSRHLIQEAFWVRTEVFFFFSEVLR